MKNITKNVKQSNKGNNKKLDKLQDKKQKEKDRQMILKQLQEHQLSSEQMLSLHSIKHSTSGKAIAIKQKQYTPIEDEVEQPVEQPIVNIFQTRCYTQEGPIVPVGHIVKQTQESKLSEGDRLEMQAKQMLPDLLLETFDKKPVPKHQKLNPGDQKQVREHEGFDMNQDVYDLDPNLMLNADELLNKHINFTPNHLDRNEVIAKQRCQLPILLQENEIIDSIKSNLISLVSGETGCGKSTQIPQFLYEAGFTEFGMIGITQPRRLAAISLAQRVSVETGMALGQEICYQVKHESSGVSDKMVMKFMTDGILLNELQTNALLPQYSVIIIDEAHERKVNIDILIGVLSRIVVLRAKLQDKYPPLRLVIMSATLRVEDFMKNKEVFPRQLSLINVPARQYPVQIHFNKVTKDDYLEAAVEKCLKIHKQLPAGDVLIFLTGQKEIKICCNLLEQKLEQLANRLRRHMGDEMDDEQQIGIDKEDVKSESSDEVLDVDNDVYQKSDYVDLKNMVGTNMISDTLKLSNQLIEFRVLPLYSKLDMKQQDRIFNNNPTQQRMIVVATNVAETSITIPTIRYVIDAGKQKHKMVDNQIGLEKHVIDWISQASANQRSGRAGRTGPGHCYRLYSTAVYSNRFKSYNEPEITTIPLDNVVLSMKSIGIMDVFKFPYLSPPDKQQLQNSLDMLTKLGAIKSNNQSITTLGQILATIPISPKFSKLLLQARAQGIFHYGLLLVCILSVEELVDKGIFHVETQVKIQQFDDVDEKNDEIQKYDREQQQIQQQHKDQQQQLKSIKDHLKQFGHGNEHSDLINLMNVIGLFMKQLNPDADLNKQVYTFANTHKLLGKVLIELYYNILQILEIFLTIVDNKDEIQQTIQQLRQYTYPNNVQQVLISNLIIQTNGLSHICRLQRKLDVENKTMRSYYASRQQEEVFIHPSSMFHGKQMPEFITYQNIVDFGGNQTKLYLIGVTKIDDINLVYQMDKRSDQLKKLQLAKESVWYNQNTDQILCEASAVIDSHWTIDKFYVPYPQDQFGLYSTFARLLLNGDILQFFKAMSKHYQIKITDIKESNMQPYSQKIIKCFLVNKIHSKKQLQSKWENDSNFLLNEFLLILDPKYHELVRSKWPPIE